MTTSNNGRCKKHWQDIGYIIAKVEYFNSFTKRSHDMFGIFDFVAVGCGEVVFIQVTSRSNMSARVRKIEDDENAATVAACRDANVRIIVEGYGKMANGKIERREVDLS